ncbi:MAG: FecR domain-containing protein [Dysgonamonadaceae bacterium]|jgi:ferric-dicitrate binding protein FerR (iron transport regulator)|nr:FecR domain-containing protein [Dysgonamonadaceae bacterium]
MEESVRKYFQGELSREECLELLRRSETDTALKTAFIRHRNMLSLLEFVPAKGDREKAQADYTAFIAGQKRKSTRQILMLTFRYAAAILCLTIGTWYAASLYFSDDRTGAVAMQTLHVPAGQRISLTLADGSVVWLNSCTKLTYPTVFNGNERHVTLEGEAYFDVAKDARKPFIVSSGNMEVKVLGTSFNLYGYPEEAFSRVSLIEGSLQVYAHGGEPAGIVLCPNSEAIVGNGAISVTEIPDRNYFLWTKGIYSFENEVFRNILERLELYYDIHIDVRDVTMLQWRYTVKFRQRDGIREILNLMREIHKFSMNIDEENNVITIDR